jgi:uncharacterized protein with HEPN domain
MPSKRNPIVYIEDILTAIDRIGEYVGGISFGTFEDLVEKQDAVIRRLSILSEAVDRLRATGVALEANVDWAAIHNLGNILRHEYDSVDLSTIWKIAHEDLPVLQQVVKAIPREHLSEIPRS